MTDNTSNTVGSTELRLGDRVDVHGKEPTRYSGYVEDIMPQMKILWVRDEGTGERKMLSTEECHISRSETQSDQPQPEVGH